KANREKTEAERGHVCQHVAGIGQQRKRVGIKSSDEFGDKERCSDDQRGFQAAAGAPVTLRAVSVTVARVVHTVDIIIGAMAWYNNRFSRRLRHGMWI